MQTTFQRVIESKILQESLWTTHSGSVIPLTTRTSTDPELQAAFAPFCAARRRPISHFPALNTHSLWETCTSRVACLFSTIPCAKWNGWVGGGPVNQCLEVKWSELKPGLRLQPRPSFQCQWARGGASLSHGVSASPFSVTENRDRDTHDSSYLFSSKMPGGATPAAEGGSNSLLLLVFEHSVMSVGQAGRGVGGGKQTSTMVLSVQMPGRTRHRVPTRPALGPNVINIILRTSLLWVRKRGPISCRICKNIPFLPPSSVLCSPLPVGLGTSNN